MISLTFWYHLCTGTLRFQDNHEMHYTTEATHMCVKFIIRLTSFDLYSKYRVSCGDHIEPHSNVILTVCCNRYIYMPRCDIWNVCVACKCTRRKKWEENARRAVQKLWRHKMAAAASCDVTYDNRFAVLTLYYHNCQFRVSINVKTTRFNVRLIKR